MGNNSGKSPLDWGVKYALAGTIQFLFTCGSTSSPPSPATMVKGSKKLSGGKKKGLRIKNLVGGIEQIW